MMSDYLHCGLIVLIAVHSGLSSVSDTENVSISCCQGETIQLFKNIISSNSGPVNLYLNGIRQTLIVTWESPQNATFLPGYKETLFQDEYGTLWIRNIQISHEGKYVLSYKINDSNVKSEVQVDVMVAPTKQCKPQIKKDDRFLIASLEESECGRPPAYVEWRNQSGISIIEKKILKLPPENEISTYSACAETPALKCVKTLKISDYCTTFTIEGEVSRQQPEVAIGKDKDIGPPVSTEMSDTKVLTFVMFAILLIVVLVMAFILMCRRKKRCNAMLTDTKENDEQTQPLTEEQTQPLTEEQTQPLTEERPYEILKNPEKSEVEMRLFPAGIEYTTVEATIEHQANTGSASTSEIQELRQTVLCNICNKNKMIMYHLLCDHNIADLNKVSSYLPICANCIHSLPQRAQCIRFNSNKVNDEMFWTNM